MSADQYSAILIRLDGLERQARGRRLERLLILVLLVCFVTSGPALRSLQERWLSLRLMTAGLSARVALDWSLAQFRRLVTVQPAIDPRTVLQDEREALEDTTSETSRAGKSNASSAGGSVNYRLVLPPSPVTNRDNDSVAPATSNILQNLRADITPRVPATAPNPRSHDGVSLPVSPASAAAADYSAVGPGVSVEEAGKGPIPSSVNSAKTAPVASGQASGLRDRSAAAGNKSIETVRRTPVVLPGGSTALSEGLLQSTVAQVVASESEQAGPQAAALPEAAEPIRSTAASRVALKALGYAQSGGSSQAILTDGATLYIVNEGEEFADRFRVVAIRPEELDIEDRLAGEKFQLPFGH